MKTSLLTFSAIILLLGGCCSPVYKQPSQTPVVFVDNSKVDGIVLHKADCTAAYVQSLLGPPAQIDYEGRLLRYTAYGFDLWFSGHKALSEIHLRGAMKQR